MIVESVAVWLCGSTIFESESESVSLYHRNLSLCTSIYQYVMCVAVAVEESGVSRREERRSEGAGLQSAAALRVAVCRRTAIAAAAGARPPHSSDHVSLCPPSHIRYSPFTPPPDYLLSLPSPSLSTLPFLAFHLSLSICVVHTCCFRFSIFYSPLFIAYHQ